MFENSSFQETVKDDHCSVIIEDGHTKKKTEAFIIPCISDKHLGPSKDSKAANVN